MNMVQIIIGEEFSRVSPAMGMSIGGNTNDLSIEIPQVGRVQSKIPGFGVNFKDPAGRSSVWSKIPGFGVNFKDPAGREGLE